MFSFSTSGNIFFHSDEAANIAFSEDGFLPCMKKYLYSSHPHIVKECLWVLSNFLATGEPFVSAVVKVNLLPSFLMLLSGLNQNIKKEVI